MNRRRLIKSAVAATVAPVALLAGKLKAAEPKVQRTTYQIGWYIEAPVYATAYLVPNRKSLDALFRRNPRLATWCVVPIGSQFLLEEPYESSLCGLKRRAPITESTRPWRGSSPPRLRATTRERCATVLPFGGCSPCSPQATSCDVRSAAAMGSVDKLMDCGCHRPRPKKKG